MRYNKNDCDEIGRHAHDLHHRRGWSLGSSLEVAIGCFNAKTVVVGILSLIVAAFVIITLFTDIKDSIVEKWTMSHHTCAEQSGYMDPRGADGYVLVTCSLCGKEAAKITPTSRVLITEGAPGCADTRTNIEHWTWEYRGTTHEDDYVSVSVPCEPVHKPVVFSQGTPATCTKDGIADGIKCEECNLVLQMNDVIPAGHQLYTDTDRVEPTCGEEGFSGTKRCRGCDYVEAGTVLPALGEHQFYTLADASEPTCDDYGYTGSVRCSGCDYQADGEWIPPTGICEYRFQERHYEPSDDTFYLYYRCKGCGKLKTEVDPDQSGKP